MSKKKKLFSSLTKVTVGALAGAAIMLGANNAFAGDDHGHDHGDGTHEEGDGTHEDGEHSCSGEKSCSGEESCSGEGGCGGEKN
ncbi:MAG: hypothetical protein R3A13_01700 [Bdellovibrionota bacterium]